MIISNWGNFPKIDAQLYSFKTIEKLRELILFLPNAIARGFGRCYGDSSLANHIISMKDFNQIISFDDQKGFIRCQAGVSLETILNLVVPKGWFLSVTPGTKYVTVGGAVASDVHGKNHHKLGNFSNFVSYLTLLLSDGTLVTCSSDKNKDLFDATCGGMGLTGVIVEVGLHLTSINTAYIRQKTIKTKNLQEVIKAFEKYKEYTYSVAWIDCFSTGKCLGRSILFLGEHADVKDISKKNYEKNPLSLPKKNKGRIPFFFPHYFLNSLFVKVFNYVYYFLLKEKISVVDYDQFFYPLDKLYDWNKMYGKKGFVQYQFVLPKKNSETGLTEILKEITKSQKGSFLAVLKLLGQEKKYLSFPMEGFTLALDFPVSSNPFSLLEKLDSIVIAYGGRLYLSKDSRMSKEIFKSSYVNKKDFLKEKVKADKVNLFQSLQSKRIGI